MPPKPELTRFLELARSKKQASAQIVQARPDGILPKASEEQCQLWLHNEFAGQAPIYNEPFALRFHCDIDPAAMERALNYIVQRHEAWRTTFEWDDGDLVQVVAEELNISVPVTDVSGLTPEKRESHALDLARIDSRRPINLAQLPLFRARLVHYDRQEWRLNMVIHHLICDGVSIYQVFVPELASAYQAFASGKSPDLPPLRYQYPDYSYWRQQQANSQNSELPHLEFWQAMLSGELPSVAKLADLKWPEERRYQGGIETLAVSPEVTGRLKEVAASANATLYMTLLSAFHVLLYSQAAVTDQLIGTVSSGRKTPGSDRLLGYFVNTIPIRSKVNPTETFIEFLGRTRDVTLDVLSNEVPFAQLVKRFARHREPGLSPLIQIMFSLEPSMLTLPDGWEYIESDVDGFSKQDLDLLMGERNGSLTGRFTYRSDMFRRETVAQLRDRLMKLLLAVADDPNRPVSELAELIRERSARSDGSRWLKWFKRTVNNRPVRDER